eukprot:scaffold23119_cov58-Phaeocystis_antarctica.AAC.3
MARALEPMDLAARRLAKFLQLALEMELRILLRAKDVANWLLLQATIEVDLLGDLLHRIG